MRVVIYFHIHAESEARRFVQFTDEGIVCIDRDGRHWKMTLDDSRYNEVSRSYASTFADIEELPERTIFYEADYDSEFQIIVAEW